MTHGTAAVWHSPPGAEAAEAPISVVVTVVVRHYCRCVSEEEVLRVTRRASLAARAAPDREMPGNERVLDTNADTPIINDHIWIGVDKIRLW